MKKNTRRTTNRTHHKRMPLIKRLDRTINFLSRMNALLSVAQGKALTENKAAVLLQVTPQDLREHRKAGEITYTRIKGRILYTREDLMAYLKHTRGNAA